MSRILRAIFDPPPPYYTEELRAVVRMPAHLQFICLCCHYLSTQEFLSCWFCQFCRVLPRRQRLLGWGVAYGWLGTQTLYFFAQNPSESEMILLPAPFANESLESAGIANVIWKFASPYPEPELGTRMCFFSHKQQAHQCFRWSCILVQTRNNNSIFFAAMLLQKDPAKRPKVAEILELPIKPSRQGNFVIMVSCFHSLWSDCSPEEACPLWPWIHSVNSPH